MAPQPAPSPKVCFGPFEFDPAAGELTKYDTRVRLQGQPVLILTMLLYQPGEVVTREDLRRYLWPGRAMAEADTSLDLAMERLRQALGDAGKIAQYIETLPGSGYRFIGRVHSLREVVPMVAADNPVAEAKPLIVEGPPSEVSWRSRVSWRWRGTALAVLVVCGTLGWLWRKPAGPGTATESFVTAPDGFVIETSAERQTLAVSPDGAKLAFLALDASATARVFLAEIDKPKATARELPGTMGAEALFWTADSRALMVAVKGKLHRVDPAANTFHTLADVPSGMMSGTWLSTDRVMLAGWSHALTWTQTDSTPRDAGAAYHWPQALPDGVHLIHSLFDPAAGRHQVRAHLIDGVAGDGWDLAQADSRAIYAPGAEAGGGHLLFVEQGDLMARRFDSQTMRSMGDAVRVARDVPSSRATGAAGFSVSENGVLAYQRPVRRSQLVWVDRAGKEVSTIGGADGVATAGRVSPDGSRIVAAIYDAKRGEQDLWTIDSANGERRRVSIAVAMRDEPLWSPDGKRLAYLRGSAPRAPQTYFRDLGVESETNADSSVPGRTTRETPGDWSPDGRFLLVVTTGYPRFEAEQQSDIAAVDLLRDRRRRPLIVTRFDESLPSFSPDGRWLAFVSNESGEPEVYAQEFEGGEEPALLGLRQLVSRGGAQALRWRRDGKELFYLSLDGQVFAVPVRWGEKKPEFGSAKALFRVSPEARAVGPGRLGFDVSADGERFLIAKTVPGEKSGVVVVRNWESRLGAR